MITLLDVLVAGVCAVLRTDSKIVLDESKIKQYLCGFLSSAELSDNELAAVIVYGTVMKAIKDNMPTTTKILNQA